MDYATIDAFRRDPVKVWEFYALRLDALATAQPNAGHLALAELERRGVLPAGVTHNIHGPHQAGAARDGVEVDRSIRGAPCPSVGRGNHPPTPPPPLPASAPGM